MLGVLEKVQYSDWATPVVSVPKPDGSMRLCGDFKITINPVLQIDQHPLPKPEDLLATLAGGKKFSKIDLSQAYQQMVLEPEHRKYTTINTHLGLFQFNYPTPIWNSICTCTISTTNGENITRDSKHHIWMMW